MVLGQRGHAASKSQGRLWGVGAAIMSACCLASGDGVGWDGGFGQAASRKGVEC